LQEAKLGMAVRLDETAARCAALEGRHREQQVRQQEPPQAAPIANLSSNLSGEQRPCPGGTYRGHAMHACMCGMRLVGPWVQRAAGVHACG
jgi:hypothetical protein